MGLKRSYYNIEVDKIESENVLIYNSFTSALGLMDSKTQEIYYSIEKFDNWKSMDDEEVKSNIKIMIENGFLVDSELDEIAALNVLENMQKYDSDRLNLVIAPTLNCNMACPYCYENKNSKRFDFKIKEALVNFIDSYVKKHSISKLEVVWYGGEPLLEKETIKELTKSFMELCNKHNLKYSASIVTNGSLLDYETGLLLKECEVKYVQVTIDGLEETNNKRRILVNGENSFEIIVKNIKACEELFTIAVRVNVDKKNSKEVSKLYDYFMNENRYNKNVNIYFAQVKDIDNCVANSHQCMSNEEFGELQIELVKRISDGLNNNRPSKYPTGKVIPCAAVTMHNYIIDPEGYLYRCWEEVGVQRKSVGDVFYGFNLNKRAVDWLSLKLPNECEGCKLRPICNSGCPLRRLDGENVSYCEHITVSYKELLKKYYDDYIQQNKIS